MPRQAVDHLRAAAAPRARTACRWSSAPSGASSRRWAARCASPAWSRTWTSPTAGCGACPRPRVTSRPTWRCWRSAIAPATPTACCCAGACRSQPKPFQLGVRIEQPQASIDQARYGHNAGHPALGAADYSASVRAGRRDLFTFCMCAGGYVMPSVSDPGYFCTNGMSESRHDSPFANSGLVVTIEPGETGQRPSAGGDPLPAAERAAGLPGGRPHVRRAAPVGPGLPRRSAQPGDDPDELPARRQDDRPAALPARSGCRCPGARPPGDRPAVRRPLPPRRDAHGPRVARQLAGPDPPRPETRESPGVAGLYPCGEGAGYAGGIISAAVDGLRTARAIVAAYANRL